MLAYNNHNILGEVTVKSLALVSYKHHVILCCSVILQPAHKEHKHRVCEYARILVPFPGPVYLFLGKKIPPLLTAVIINWRYQDIHVTHPRSFRRAEAQVTHSQRNTASCSLCFTELPWQKIYILKILYKYLGLQVLRSYATTLYYFFFICKDNKTYLPQQFKPGLISLCIAHS